MDATFVHRGRRKVTAELLAAQDPLAPQGALPPTAASEVVKAARAYLQDPTRPVTPSEPSRHLLQSSCSYSNRPQTAANTVGSHEFLSAAATDGICWGGKSSSGQADIWIADAEPSRASSTWGAVHAGPPAGIQGAGRSVPGVRRTTVSAPSAQPLPVVTAKISISNSSSRSRTASAGGVSTGSRLAELGALAPLRPATAAKAAAASPALTSEPTVAADAGLGAAVSTGSISAWRYSSPASEAEAWQAPMAERSSGAAAAREPSTSTEASSIVRPVSGGGPCSRGSTAGSCRSRLSSRGSEQPSVRDSLSLAEAELDQLLLDADAAAEEPSVLQPQGQQDTAAARRSSWRRDVLQALQQIQALSLSPTDAPALLQHCSDLQCLLATAADWGYLQEWLGPVQAQGCRAAAPTTQLQPCVSRNLTSSRTVSSSSSKGSRDGVQDTGADLQGALLQALVRLVDSKKPDVLVKVGAMLLSIAPPGSNLLLPATKMLYSLSKDSSNDSRFRHHGVLRPLLQMTAALSTALEQQRQQQHTSTALLYCSGCLKNVSADSTNQKSLGRLGGVSTMAQVLLNQVSIAAAVAAAQQEQQYQHPPQQRPRHPQHETAAQVAVQASAVMRNLSVVAANADLFVQQQAGALQAIIGLLQPFQHDPEVLLNASRCLSKLSMYDSCRQGMVPLGGQQGERSSSRNSSQRSSAGKPDSSSGSRAVESSAGASSTPAAVGLMVRVLLNIQAAQPKQWPTGVRLAFALAQLTTYQAEARLLVAAVPGALDALPGLVLKLAQVCSQQRALQQQQPQTQQEQRQSALAEDLMTKLLRVLANLAIDRTSGPALAAKQATADALVAVLTGYEYEAAEELVLNATAALTNLAFYDTPSNKLLQTDADVLLMALLPLLTSGNEESMCEAARAVGNLARASPAARAALLLCDEGLQPEQQQQEGAQGFGAPNSSPQHTSAGPYVLQSLVLLLDHGSWEVVCSVAGALVNLAALPEAGTALSRVGLAAALAGALQRVQDFWEQQDGQQDGQQQPQDEVQDVCIQASELILQCVANMVAASAAAMSDAIMGSSGPRCADLSCSSEDLACFSSIVTALSASAEGGTAGHGVDGHLLVPDCIIQTAKMVRSQLESLWGM